MYSCLGSNCSLGAPYFEVPSATCLQDFWKAETCEVYKGREEHSMDRCRCRPELSKQIWKPLVHLNFKWNPYWCLEFRENLYRPMALKVRQQFPPRLVNFSRDGSSQKGANSNTGLQNYKSTPGIQHTVILDQAWNIQAVPFVIFGFPKSRLHKVHESLCGILRPKLSGSHRSTRHR